MELDRNIYKSNLAAKLSEKYVEIWQTVDPQSQYYRSVASKVAPDLLALGSLVQRQ